MHVFRAESGKRSVAQERVVAIGKGVDAARCLLEALGCLFKFSKDCYRYRQMGALGNPDRKTFQANYRRLLGEIISQDKFRREAA
jgi:hypothetical protein